MIKSQVSFSYIINENAGHWKSEAFRTDNFNFSLSVHIWMLSTRWMNGKVRRIADRRSFRMFLKDSSKFARSYGQLSIFRCAGLLVLFWCYITESELRFLTRSILLKLVVSLGVSFERFIIIYVNELMDSFFRFW